jgi:hypothetical protein
MEAAQYQTRARFHLYEQLARLAVDGPPGSDSPGDKA